MLQYYAVKKIDPHGPEAAKMGARPTCGAGLTIVPVVPWEGAVLRTGVMCEDSVALTTACKRVNGGVSSYMEYYVIIIIIIIIIISLLRQLSKRNCDNEQTTNKCL